VVPGGSGLRGSEGLGRCRLGICRAESLYPEYAEEIDPMRQSAWIEAYNAGVTALQANNMEEAIKSLSVANTLYRKRPEAMVTLGSVYVQQGNLAAAEAVFKDALAVCADRSARSRRKRSWRSGRKMSSRCPCASPTSTPGRRSSRKRSRCTPAARVTAGQCHGPREPRRRHVARRQDGGGGCGISRAAQSGGPVGVDALQHRHRPLHGTGLRPGGNGVRARDRDQPGFARVALQPGAVAVCPGRRAGDGA
jgi:hypothetical protein